MFHLEKDISYPRELLKHELKKKQSEKKIQKKKNGGQPLLTGMVRKPET